MGHRETTQAASTPANVHRNNFDILRLAAAMQVALLHLSHHMDLPIPGQRVMAFFPGVPIFFFISGYLIYGSYCRSVEGGGVARFYINRALRIYPGLFGCFGLSVLSVALTGYWNNHDLQPGQFLAWVASSLTCFQFWNPDSLRGYGTGVVNGSLWTISVELQFYAITPLLHRVICAGGWKPWLMLGVLVFANAFATHGGGGEGVAWKLFKVSFAPWLGMFMFGAMVGARDGLRAFILGWHPLAWLGGYVACYWMLGMQWGLGSGNGMNFPSFVMLACTVLGLAYWRPTLSWRTLKGNDISYGLYIYHMPIANLLLVFGMRGTVLGFALAVALSLIFAASSWFFLEKRALGLKNMGLLGVQR